MSLSLKICRVSALVILRCSRDVQQPLGEQNSSHPNFNSSTTSNMSAPINKEKVQEQAQEIHKIKITLTSTKVKALEKVCANIVKNANDNQVVKKGPVRMPTKVLKITTRKTPNGEGSKTWDAYEMRIHKRVIDLQAPASLVKKITVFNMEPGVDIEVTVAA